MVPNRTSSTNTYRYGFQGQEKDNEIKGEGNSLNYTFRMHDPRVGRFFATDPVESEYPHNSPYAFSENRVVDAVELEGLEMMKTGFVWWYWLKKNYTNLMKVKIVHSEDNNKRNKQVLRALKISSVEIFEEALGYTDVDDATVIVTTFTRGDKAINTEGKVVNKTQKALAAGGLFLPLVSGAAIGKIAKVLSKSDGLVKGTVNVTEEALEYAKKSKNALKDLDKLKFTAEELSNRGFDVIIKGEGVVNGSGELTLDILGKQIAAESKRLSSNSVNAAQKAIQDGTKQAGNGGVTIIDGTASGTTFETFKEGFETFLRNSAKERKKLNKTGKDGTIMFLGKDNETSILQF